MPHQIGKVNNLKKDITNTGKKGRSTPIDCHVGMRLRERRTQLSLSQDSLANTMGLTFQQLQKYERGLNRISASRLYDLSQALEVDVTYFYEGLESPALVADEDNSPIYEIESEPERDVFELARHFNRIRDPEARKRILKIVKALAGEGEIPDEGETPQD